MTKRVECICGAMIHVLDGEDPTDPDAVWLDDKGNDRCYPNEPGNDGEARHEPLDEVSDDSQSASADPQ